MYTLRSDGSVTRDADAAVIPADPGNTDWQAYRAWCATGNVATPTPVVVPVRTATVSALLDALSATQRTAITPDHMNRLANRAALTVGRVPVTDAKVLRAATDMGLTPDAWFTLAGA